MISSAGLERKRPRLPGAQSSATLLRRIATETVALQSHENRNLER
jgi:hypothetical protein